MRPLRQVWLIFTDPGRERRSARAADARLAASSAPSALASRRCSCAASSRGRSARRSARCWGRSSWPPLMAMLLAQLFLRPIHVIKSGLTPAAARRDWHHLRSAEGRVRRPRHVLQRRERQAVGGPHRPRRARRRTSRRSSSGSRTRWRSSAAAASCCSRIRRCVRSHRSRAAVRRHAGRLARARAEDARVAAVARPRVRAGARSWQPSEDSEWLVSTPRRRGRGPPADRRDADGPQPRRAGERAVHAAVLEQAHRARAALGRRRARGEEPAERDDDPPRAAPAEALRRARRARSARRRIAAAASRRRRRRRSRPWRRRPI